MLFQTQTGPQTAQDGSIPAVRSGKLGDVIVSELHGRFYEQTYRGNVYSAGANVTALSANTITTANTATGTPIVGVWNPLSSTANLVILQIGIWGTLNTWTTPTAPGLFLIATSTGNGAITTGAAPFNRRTLTTTGSQAKAFNGGVALTGLTTNLTVLEGLDIPSMQGTGAMGTITAPTTMVPAFGGVQNFDGHLIVPPGGVLSVMNQNSTTTTSVATRLVWEEVPL